MDVLESVKGRRSIRQFRKKEITGDLTERLIDALIWAPSAGNLQSRKFFFIVDDAVKRAVAAAALGQVFIAQAPLVVVGCTDSRIMARYGERGRNLYSIQDCSASIMCMMLAAHELGLGTVWVGAFDEDAVSEVLALPRNLRPVAIVPVGWPEKVPKPPSRVGHGEAVQWV